MKRKNLFGITAILLMLIASCAARQANNSNHAVNGANNARAAVKEPDASATPPARPPEPEPVVQINKDPKTLVLAFYEFYVDGFPNIQDEGASFKDFLTIRFFNAAWEADDYDIFLDAQDFDNTWKGNVSVSNAVIKGNKATVDVMLRGETFKWTRRVSLVKQRGVWKIDGVKRVKED